MDDNGAWGLYPYLDPHRLQIYWHGRSANCQAMRERENLTLLTTFRGHNLYEWEDVSMIPAGRYLALLYHAHDSDRTVSHDDLMKFVELSREAYNSGNLSKVGAMIETLAVHLDSYLPDKVNFKMANCLILVDDEPVDQMTKHHEKIKASIYDHPEMRAFFLRTLFRHLEGFGLSQDSTKTLLDQLSQDIQLKRDPNEEAFSRLIGEPTFVSYLTA